MNCTPHIILPALLCSVTPFAYANTLPDESSIEQITVEASPTANKLPVGTFDSPISNL